MKKIKKLTYAEMTKVSTRLTREEMRQIMAGSGPGDDGGGNCSTCNCVVCYGGVDTTSICVSSCTGYPSNVCNKYPGDWGAMTWGICSQCC